MGKMRGMEKSLSDIEMLLERIPDAVNYPVSSERETYFDDTQILELINARADASVNRIKQINDAAYFYRWLKSMSDFLKHNIWQALETRGWHITFSEFLNQISNESLDPDVMRAIDNIAQEGEFDE